jgi:CTP synthase (UTP-ammonia lyase)
VLPKTLRIGLIGDHQPKVMAHVAVARSLELTAAASTEWRMQVEWLSTDTLECLDPGAVGIPACPDRLLSYDGLWCVPASPYVSMAGALRAIRFAREHRVPFLGTCGGFQHALIEYARNVLGLTEADHEETRPDGTWLLISRLACPLVEQTSAISIVANSRLREFYGCDSAAEVYHCNFGLNQTHEKLLENGDLRLCARDSEGNVRALELNGHPFFVATLFQPERAGLRGEVHPIIGAFVQACFRYAR